MSEDTVDYIGTDLKFDMVERDLDGSSDDLLLVSGTNNLAQSIFLRLMSRMGSDPFDPEYGSRIHFLVGKGQSVDNEVIGEMYVGESLLRDPRIISVDETNVKYEGNELFVDVSIVGINSIQPVDVRAKVKL